MSGLFSNGLVIAEGASSAVLNVVAKADAVVDANETVKLNLVAASNSYNLDYPTGGNGIVTTDFGGSEYGFSTVLQADGKIVVSGFQGDANNGNFVLARYNSNGLLDTSFDSDGKVITDVGQIDYTYGMTIQPDGKILVTGTSNGLDFTLVRYNSNGSLDNSFDGDGKVTTGVASNGAESFSVVAQPDGKVIVAGYAVSGGDNNLTVVRYNSNGSLDSSFGNGGKVGTSAPNSYSGGVSAVLQSDGKILASGLNDDTSGILIRYNSNGTLDSSFDGDGKVILSNVYLSGLGKSLSVQTDGKILVTGSVTGSGSSDFYLARYNANGTLDTTFDSDGKVTTDFGFYEEATSITIQLDGKILVAGDSGGGFALARYNSNGSLDTSFDGDGKVTTSMGTSYSQSYSVVVQTDGKILVSGYKNSSNNADFALFRYNSDGSLDTTFNATSSISSTLTITDTSTPILTTPSPITYTDTAMDDTFTNVTGQFTATYPATTNTITYGIDGGTDNGIGIISKTGNYGTLTLNKSNGQYSFVPNDAAIEPLTADTSENFTITVSSNGTLADSKALAINIKQSGDTESIGDDILKGTAGNDTINGLAGDDIINGLAGTDTMKGDTGEDIYIVDTSSDVIIETSADVNEIDTVFSKANYILSNNVEILILRGTAAINGTGNASENIITGNFGDNILDGLTGADIMTGRGGNDTYTVDNAADVVIEKAAQGTLDRVNSSINYTLPANVENLTLTGTTVLNGTGNVSANSLIGNSAANNLSGGNGNDTLIGNAGNDILDGGANNDVLNGGAGLDVFRLMTAGNVDTIQDFNRIEGDKIQIENAVFTKLVATGVLADTLFKNLGLGAQDTDDFILYNPSNLTVSYDADANGAGVAVQIAVLGVSTALMSSDFVVI